jgi:hypothetical protein
VIYDGKKLGKFWAWIEKPKDEIKMWKSWIFRAVLGHTILWAELEGVLLFFKEFLIRWESEMERVKWNHTTYEDKTHKEMDIIC